MLSVVLVTTEGRLRSSRGPLVLAKETLDSVAARRDNFYVPTLSQMIYNVTSTYPRISDAMPTYPQGCVFHCRDVYALIEAQYPGTNRWSIQPSDYLFDDALKPDPGNEGTRHKEKTYPRFLRRIAWDSYVFGRWDGHPPGAIDAPVTR
jgi:hypothetical protein